MERPNYGLIKVVPRPRQNFRPDGPNCPLKGYHGGSAGEIPLWTSVKQNARIQNHICAKTQKSAECFRRFDLILFIYWGADRLTAARLNPRVRLSATVLMIVWRIDSFIFCNFSGIFRCVEKKISLKIFKVSSRDAQTSRPPDRPAQFGGCMKWKRAASPAKRDNLGNQIIRRFSG